MRGTKLHVGSLGLAVVVAVALFATACSKSTDGGGSVSSSAGGSGAVLTVKDFQFDPGTLSVASGQSTITITNEGSAVHSFTLDDGTVSQDIAPGESQTVTVNVTGDAGFHCKYHSSMTGTLRVG